MIKNVFDWVKEINGNKREWNLFSNAEQELFNSYVIHRVLSMNPDFIEIVNEAQSLPPSHKKQIYSIYREFIPKNNKWFKYIKSNTKEPNNDLVLKLKDYFKVSIREIKDYLKILDKKEVQSILNKQGLEEKEIKKLLK
jgi:carbonic anhydrase